MSNHRTPDQIAASRANGAKSRGPKSPEGKAASRLNATRHGVFTAALLVKDENEEELIELHRSYHDQFHPRGAAEEALVADMIQARWRILRLLRWEQRNPPTYFEQLERPARLQARLQRQHESALRALLALRRNEPKDPVKPKKLKISLPEIDLSAIDPTALEPSELRRLGFPEEYWAETDALPPALRLQISPSE